MIDDVRDNPERKRFFGGLAVILGLTAFVWVGYGWTQPHYDPRHADPGFDAAYYVEWSDAILSGEPAPRFEGAFYRAPLYPYLLSALRGPLGAGQAGARWIQILVALAATGWLAYVAYRWGGTVAGLGTAFLLGAYQPWMFFSTRLVSESWAIVLLVSTLPWIARRGARWAAVAGVLTGLAALARPSLLLVAVGWAAWAAFRGDRFKAIVLVLATAITVLPVTVANWHRSGHFVPVSANGGLTLYHGNGPGAEGVFTHVAGMSGAVRVQREESTALASRLQGRPLDPVESDRFWGRQALRQRLSEPLNSLRLGWNRMALLLGTREIALDEAPALDPNPWSRATFVPFALLVALAAAAAASPRRAAVAEWAWIAIAACAATPLLFYVSSRYRLPFAVLLALPAGVGLSELVAGRKRAIVAALAMAAVSMGVPWIAELTMPYDRLLRSERASGYAQHAQACLKRAATAAEDVERKRWDALARKSIERGLRFGSDSPELLCVVARLAQDDGRTADAEAAWLAAWESRGGAPGPRLSAAINLSAMWIKDGRASRAADLLTEALELAPLDELAWNNRIVALITSGRITEARRALRRAADRGVVVNPELEAVLSAGGGTQ
jgi:tetratricopeptide (TPR) repeat protein